MGMQLLQALFFETTPADKTNVVYTLKTEDHLGYPSLYRLYMEADDPTEYTFAVQYLDGWSHWEKLCECSWFKDHVTQWRKELELRTRATSLKAIREIAASDPKQALLANKFLVSAGWKDAPEKRRAGAPSKEDVRQEAHRIASTEKTINEDFDRITGKVN